MVVEFTEGCGLVNVHLSRKREEAEREQLVSDLKDALAKVKTLYGLLPVCAWCKKFRSDEGDWQSLERYIAEHTEALITHGICPDCREKVYAPGKLME